MNSRLDRMVSEHDHFILRDHSRDWRRIAWVEPKDDGTVELHASLQRQVLIGVARPYSDDRRTQLYMLAPVEEVVIDGLDAATETSRLIAIAQSELDRAEAIARQALEDSLVPQQMPDEPRMSAAVVPQMQMNF